MPEPAVVVRDASKTYGTTRALDGLALEARPGEVTALLGPNGAGKTTLVECLVGLRHPDTGTVRVLGLDPVQDAAQLRPRVGVMLQDGGLPLWVRSIHVLRHVASLYADPWPVEDLVARLGLESFAGTTVRRLSGGQRQRLAMAVALVGRPDVVLLDEPSAGLDPQSRRVVWDLVDELRTRGTTIMLTTHLMDEAATLADAVLVVDHGRVIASGSVAELTTSSGLVRFTTGSALDAAALEGALALPVLESHPCEYTITGTGTPALVAEVAAWCAEHGVQITTLDVGRRSLEDVFLDLTGKELR